MKKNFQIPAKYKNKKPLWDLEKDGITFSMLSQFLICRERFRLTSVEGWTSKGLSIPIEFGQIFHWVLEKKINSPRTSISKLIKDDLKRRKKTLKKSQLEDYEIVLGLVQVTIDGYFEYWKSIPTFEHPITSVKYYDNDLKSCLGKKCFVLNILYPMDVQLYFEEKLTQLLENHLTKLYGFRRIKLRETLMGRLYQIHCIRISKQCFIVWL